jgi:hypothetical protein
VNLITWIIRVSAHTVRESELSVHFQVCGVTCRVDSVNLADILEVITAVFTIAVRDILVLCHRIVTVLEERLKARDFVRFQWCRHRAMPNGSPPY